jgi:hypothetical protein
VAKQPERLTVERLEQALVEGKALPVERDQTQAGTLVLAAGVDDEPIIERRLLARSATECGPKLLLAECNRVIRDHKLSRVI